MHFAAARRVLLTGDLCLIGGLCLAAVGSLSLASAAGALTQQATVRHHSHAEGRSDLVKTASVALGTCPATDVVMRALIPRLNYSANQPVSVAVVVRNVGSHTCTFGGTGNRYPEYIGPCGAISLQVDGRGGAPLWPGPVAYSCPAISATALAPGAKFTATGAWPKAIVTRSSSSGAPAGTYRLVIDRAITFTIPLR